MPIFLNHLNHVHDLQQIQSFLKSISTLIEKFPQRKTPDRQTVCIMWPFKIDNNSNHNHPESRNHTVRLSSLSFHETKLRPKN